MAFEFPRIIAARKMSVEVPSLAPKMKGIAFFKLIKRATARGTNNSIVMLEENTTAVKRVPIKQVLYFESKYLLMNFLAFSSPPKTSMIVFPMYFNVKIKIKNASPN